MKKGKKQDYYNKTNFNIIQEGFLVQDKLKIISSTFPLLHFLFFQFKICTKIENEEEKNINSEIKV